MLVAANETDTASASVHEAAVMKEAENPRCQWSGVGGSVLRGKQGGKTGRVMEKTGRGGGRVMRAPPAHGPVRQKEQGDWA